MGRLCIGFVAARTVHIAIRYQSALLRVLEDMLRLPGQGSNVLTAVLFDCSIHGWPDISRGQGLGVGSIELR